MPNRNRFASVKVMCADVIR